jgi:hypothetical protein
MSSAILKSSMIAFTAAVIIPCSSELLAAPPEKEAGTYELTFLWSSPELILWAHIESASGNAPDGVVVFQYCSYKGLPPNDITQPDEAPSSACADGSGRWRNLGRVDVGANGDAFWNFGAIQVVNIIGFRYLYSRGSVVANATTDPEDWIRS